MSRWIDLIGIAAIAGLALLFSVAPVPNIIGLPFMILFVFWGHGYAISLFLFGDGNLSLAERIAFGVGLSLAAAAISGLILHFLNLGFEKAPSLAYFAIITIVGIAGAAYRRMCSEAMLDVLKYNVPPIQIREIAVFVLAFGFIVAAILIAVWGANTQERPAFTELWALPVDQATTADGMIEFGVANHEQVSMDYRMDILVDGLVVDTIQSIQLEPEQKWESAFMVPEGEVSVIPQAITFRLYREDDETAYRQVRIIKYQENYTPVNSAPFNAP